MGHLGQDGSLLSRELIQRGYKVIGIGSARTSWFGKESDEPIDIMDRSAVRKLILGVMPEEIYYLAAYHSSSERQGEEQSQVDLFEKSQAVHVTGLLNFLSTIASCSGKTRLFYAASSLIFSGKNGDFQDEDTPFEPVGMYGITKAQGVWLCREYRARENIFVSCGFLYNHESHLRPPNFLTAKIISGAIRIAEGSDEKVTVGSLDAEVDWGYAADYVRAFSAILALDSADDFILASGESHTVEQFCESVFSVFSLNWKDHICVEKNLLFRRQPIKKGDSRKLIEKTGVELKIPFQELISRLVKDHIKARDEELAKPNYV
ncbi:GDP-mannose 4,6-dehydratase [Pseudomonadales bacterium]|nr:GDP-mannose 4,6-dehydratase [Pseudomonadales bacterium]